jgi:hypothetical protein
MYQDLQSSFTKDMTLSTNNSNQSVVGAFGTAIISKNVIDMGAPANTVRNALEQNAQVNNFDASHIPFNCQVTTTLVGGSGGVRVDIVTDSASDMITAPVVIGTFTIPALSAAGYELPIKEIPMGLIKRYLGLKFTPLTSDTTVGTIDAYIGTAKNLQAP